MNWNMIEGQWKSMVGTVKQKWGDLTDNEILETEGNYERMKGLLQNRYGMAQEDAAREIDTWAADIKDFVRQ